MITIKDNVIMPQRKTFKDAKISDLFRIVSSKYNLYIKTGSSCSFNIRVGRLEINWDTEKLEDIEIEILNADLTITGVQQ